MKIYKLKKFTNVPLRSFSTKNDDFFSQSLKTFEQFRDLLYPEDQQKELTDKEVLEEIIRSNHLAAQTLKSVGSISDKQLF